MQLRRIAVVVHVYDVPDSNTNQDIKRMVREQLDWLPYRVSVKRPVTRGIRNVKA